MRAEQKANRITLGMRRNRADNLPRQASERLFCHHRKLADAR
jgi:hypothetical protein